MLNWPPISAAASNRCTSWPRSASTRGAARPAGPGADDGDALPARGGTVSQLRLVAGARVDHAGGELVPERVVEAGLVAGDAGVDLVGAAGCRLAHELGVRQERARHGHHVGAAVREQPLGHLRRVDAVGRAERNRHLGLQLLRHPGEGRPRHRGRDGRHPRLVPADAGVDDRRAGRSMAFASVTTSSQVWPSGIRSSMESR